MEPTFTKTEKLTIAGAIFVLLLCVFGWYSVLNKSQTQSFGDAGQPNYIQGPASVIASSTVGTESTLVLASSTARLYAVIVNDSSDSVYLSIGNSAVKGMGIRLNASGGTYEINSLNLFTGAVNAISGGSGGDNVTVLSEQ